jgi:hypothetical protein
LSKEELEPLQKEFDEKKLRTANELKIWTTAKNGR